ncbi:MAG: hypothetical protein ACLFT0_17985 [Spirulinaceae cyanobacterium]
MSCSSDAPYKSRLFNFLNRQSQQWRDRGGKAARYVQLGVVWGLQILAYPAYLFVQGSRWTGRQLQQKSRQVLQQLPANGTENEVEPEELTVDRPIQRILTAVEPLLLQAAEPPEAALVAVVGQVSGVETASETGVQVSRKLQGIACCVATRSLVLVTVDNVILDVLSPEQQEQLQQRLILELADFRYSQQQQIAATEPLRFDAPPGNDSPVLKPVQWFWGVMRWVQQSPVAIAINLFQEASLVPVPSPVPPPPTLPPGLSGYSLNLERLAQLDDRLAQIEAQAESITMSFAVGKLRQQVASLATRLQDKLHTADDAAAANSMQALIYGAIDYFFGDRNHHIKVEGQEEGNSAIASLPAGGLKRLKLPSLAGLLPNAQPDLPYPLENSEDPWLTWTDLYGEETVTSQSAVAAQPQLNPGLATPTMGVAARLTPEEPGSLAPVPPQPSAPQSSPTPRKLKFWQKLRKPPSVPNPGALAATQATPEPDTPQPPSAIVTPKSQSDAIDPAFDWVETEATSVGYVKHPLEQILEWLDDIMLWLENLVVAIWQWFYRRIP